MDRVHHPPARLRLCIFSTLASQLFALSRAFFQWPRSLRWEPSSVGCFHVSRWSRNLWPAARLRSLGLGCGRVDSGLTEEKKGVATGRGPGYPLSDFN